MAIGSIVRMYSTSGLQYVQASPTLKRRRLLRYKLLLQLVLRLSRPSIPGSLLWPQ